MKKVDILLATYNGEKYLPEMLNSVLNQSYENFRLLISDDASSDGTLNIIRDYAKKDKRISIFQNSENQGITKNFESLLKRVKSDYFMFADQDDIWKKDKILNSVKKIEEGYDLVYTDLEVVDENLNITYESYWKQKGFWNKIKKYNNFNALYLNNFITGCTIISKKEFINKILPFPKDSKYVLHDYWLALMVSKFGKIGYIEEPQIMYRQHKNNKIGSKKKSLSMKSLDEIRNLFIEVKLEHFDVFIKNERRFEDAKLEALNKKAYAYFEHLSKKKYISFRGWGLFFKLYKYEDFGYKFENFLILNLPCIARLGFKLRKKS